MRTLLRVLIAILVTLCLSAAAIAAASHSEPVIGTMVDTHLPGPRTDTRCPECGLHRLRSCVQLCFASIDIDGGWLPEARPSPSEARDYAATPMRAGMTSEPPLTPPIA